MATPGDISLPITKMYETANRLESTGVEIASQLTIALQQLDSNGAQLPAAIQARHSDLQTEFNACVQRMQAARSAIARNLRSSADSAGQIDTAAARRLEPYQLP